MPKIDLQKIDLCRGRPTNGEKLTPETPIAALRNRVTTWGSDNPLPKSTRGALNRLGIYTLGDLATLTREEVIALPGIGPERTDEFLGRALGAAGLSFKVVPTIKFTLVGALAGTVIEAAERVKVSPIDLLRAVMDDEGSYLSGKIQESARKILRIRADDLRSEADALIRLANGEDF